jgi:glycosyltransferase involved in cell wall biosynthesis
VRVVIVSKALVMGTYRRKLEELAALPEIELTAIVPPAWADRRGAVRLEAGDACNYSLLVAPIILNGQYHLHFYPTIGRILRRLSPDVLHMDEEPYNLATWQALRIGQRLGARCLFFTWQNLYRRYPWPFNHLERANFKRAACAIAGNQDAASVLRRKGFRKPVSVIPQFGVDPQVFAPRPRPVPHERFVIGYAGGLVPEKGVALLLAACSGLPDASWLLQIAGEGPDRARLEALAADLPAGQVRFWGRLASTELPVFYSGLDVLALPSISRPNWVEQFGRVLVEAMACGLPVVGSDSGEIPNVIGDAGLIFPEGDIEGLRRNLAMLANDPALRATLAARGRQRVLDHFTHARVAQATYEVYCQMIDLPAG